MSSTATEFEYTSSLEKDGNIYLTKDKQYQFLMICRVVTILTTRTK